MIRPRFVPRRTYDERGPPPLGRADWSPSHDVDPSAAVLPVVSIAELADKPVPLRRWMVPDLIPDRTVTMIGGDGGDGKTTLMLQLAAAAACGKPWLGYNVEQGPNLFVSAEDDLDELHRRVAAIAMSLGVALAALADFHCVPLAGRDAVMGAPQGRAGLVAATAVFRGLIALVEKIQPRLVVMDALADVFGGEENARAQARQFIGLLRGLAIDHDLAVVIVAHPSLTGMATGSGSSGSTAWSNSVTKRVSTPPASPAALSYPILVKGKQPAKPDEFRTRVRTRSGGGVTIVMWNVAHKFNRPFQQAKRGGLRARLGGPRFRSAPSTAQTTPSGTSGSGETADLDDLRDGAFWLVPFEVEKRLAKFLGQSRISGSFLPPSRPLRSRGSSGFS